MCHSPQLIAAYHVLLRLWEPRHSPYALTLLIVLFCSFNEFTITKNLFISGVIKHHQVKKFLIEKIAFLVFLISQYVNERFWSPSPFLRLPLGTNQMKSTIKYRIKLLVFRSVASQPTSNSHLEKLLNSLQNVLTRSRWPSCSLSECCFATNLKRFTQLLPIKLLVFRSVASQPTSNSHLEKLLKVFSLVEKIKASFIFSPAFQIPLFKSFICGEYRSRTDDLLRARQAL